MQAVNVSRGPRPGRALLIGVTAAVLVAGCGSSSSSSSSSVGANGSPAATSFDDRAVVLSGGRRL